MPVLQLDDVSGARSCLAKGLSAARPWTTSIPAAWLVGGEVGQADVTPLPVCHCWRDPTKGKWCLQSHMCAGVVWGCLMEEGWT